MKVICVQQLFNHPNNVYEIPMPEVGSEYNVIGESEKYGIEFFLLAEFGDDCGYAKRSFATLPDASGDEMEEAEREAIVNLETVPA